MRKIKFRFVTTKSSDLSLEDGEYCEYHVAIPERRTLNEMPFDKEFDGELCHATGDEVLIDGEYWNEYVSNDGTTRYGR